MGDVLRVPAFRQHRHRNHVLHVLPGTAALADGIDDLAQQFLLRQPGQPPLRFRRDIGGFDEGAQLGLVILVTGGLFALFGLVQHLRIDAQRFIRRMQFRPVRVALAEIMLDTRRRLGTVADGQHDRRRGMAGRAPVLQGRAPVGAEQRIGILHQLGQRLVRPGAAAVEVVRHLGVAVEVVELRAEGFRIGQRIVAHDHPRRLHQPGLDGVVESEIRDDPAEQPLLRVRLAGRREGRGGKIEATQDAARLVQAVQSLDPARRLFEVESGVGGLLFRDLHVRRHAPGVVRLVIDDQ